ncbi:MAG TPA: hypothetical protein VK919_05530 [Solirubrobacterales bacterium]|nr:hypothetical protein [Solirubrobacterales bacterium]
MAPAFQVQPQSRRSAPPLPLALLLVPLLAAVLLTVFAWPQARSGPSDLPIGLAGPPGAVAGLERELAARAPGIEATAYPDAPAARDAIEDREVYGALTVGPDGVGVLTAPAASPAVAQLLERAADAVPTAPRSSDPAPVEVVSAAAADPRGAAFSASLLPLLIVGVLTGALAWALGRDVAGTLGFVALASVLAGVAAMAIVQGWLGVLEGGWLLNSAALALVVLAIALTATGLMSLLGYAAGLGATAVTLILIGNPWSGVSSAPELLPRPLGAIGELLPPGAAGDLLRGTAFFDGAGTADAVVVLLAWVGVGAAALVAARAGLRAPAEARAQSSPSSAA